MPVGTAEQTIKGMGRQCEGDLCFQLLLCGCGDIDDGIGGSAADKVPAPVDGPGSPVDAVVVPPGGIERLVILLNFSLKHLDIIDGCFSHLFKCIAAALPADGRCMVGMEETGDGFDIDEGMAVVELEDIVLHAPGGITRNYHVAGGGWCF